MFRADKGTVVGTCQCIDCGGKAVWKVAGHPKQGQTQLVYLQCLRLDDAHDLCKCYIRRGPKVSQKMIEKFHKHRMAGQGDETATPETANDNHAPQPDPEPENKPVEGEGGFLGG